MKYFIKIITSLILIAFVGCSDLEEEPQGILAPEGFFKTPTDVEAAIFGAYGRMASDQAWGGETTQGLLLLSDMVDVGNPGAAIQNFEINDFKATSTHWYSALMWRRAYDIIGAANTAILGAQQIDASEDIKKELEAEARVIRAFVYFSFVQIFGDMPYLDAVVTNPDAVSTMSKSSETEIYTHIIEDLEFGIEHLPMQFPGNPRTRATAGTAATILASVYLTHGDWQKAYEHAKWVIDRAEELNYGLVTDYQDLFDATQQDGIAEHIFAVDFIGLRRHSDNDDIMGPLTAVGGLQGWSILVPTMEVYDDWDDRDYRKKVSLEDTLLWNGEEMPFTEFPVVKRPHIAKYWRFPGNAQSSSRQSDHNYVLYRYAEVLLIAAEALNEISGPTAEALSYVNQVRARARIWPEYVSDFPPDVLANVTKDEFRGLILEERRLELAFEYKRWFDIKRRQLGDEVFKGSNSLEPHPDFDANKHYLLPIPQTELDINPNLSPQNPGYE